MSLPILNCQRRKHVIWMRVALAMKALSKCERAQYAAVILDADDRVVSAGYNGKPAGASNDHVCYRQGLPANAPKAKCCLHAEQNALIAGNRDQYVGGTMYLTGLPCEDCALLIAQAGLARLVCLEDPRNYPGLEVLKRYGFMFSTDAEWEPAKSQLSVLILTKAEVCEPLPQGA